MHILFLTHYFPPEVNAPATRTYEHCRRWVAAGHRLTVITCAPNCPSGVVYDGYRNTWRHEERIDGIKVLRVWTHLAANKGFLGRIFSFISYLVTATWCAMTVRGVDVVVATSPQFFCGWAGVLCRWMRRWPFVLEIRDIWPESIVAVGGMKRSLLIRLLEWLERQMYAAANHIVVVGEGYRQQLLQRNVPLEKMTVIYNGVDLSQFQFNEDHYRKPRKQDGKSKFICAYVGTVGMAHGLDVVLRAARILKDSRRDDVEFWIVGDGAERSRLQGEAVRRKLDNVIFTGLVQKHLIPKIISDADACLVHLIEKELFNFVMPSKIFESMALNVPIIIGVRGEAREIVLNARAGVAMPPGDEHALLDCLGQLAAGRNKYCFGRPYVARFFDRDRLAADMLKVLQDAAAGFRGLSVAPQSRMECEPERAGRLQKNAA